MESHKFLSRCFALVAVVSSSAFFAGCNSQSATPSKQEIQAFNPDPNKMSPETRALMEKNEAANRQKQAMAGQTKTAR